MADAIKIEKLAWKKAGFLEIFFEGIFRGAKVCDFCENWDNIAENSVF